MLKIAKCAIFLSLLLNCQASDNTKKPETPKNIEWQYKGLNGIKEAQNKATKSGKRILVGLSGSDTGGAMWKFESRGLAQILSNEDVVHASQKYECVLVRVPEAYQLVINFKASRPGILILERESKIDTFALDVNGGKEMSKSLAEFLSKHVSRKGNFYKYRSLA